MSSHYATGKTKSQDPDHLRRVFERMVNNGDIGRATNWATRGTNRDRILLADEILDASGHISTSRSEGLERYCRLKHPPQVPLHMETLEMITSMGHPQRRRFWSSPLMTSNLLLGILNRRGDLQASREFNLHVFYCILERL